MAKELPYFKFHINEWFNGDITLEDYNLQGVFVNICAYYWSKDCDLSKPNLLKKFRGVDEYIDQLIESNIIKLAGQNIRIHFLDEQYGSKEVQKIANRQNGLLGGRPKKDKTEEKPNGLNFDNPNESETKANGNPNETNIEYSTGKKRREEKKEEYIDPLFESAFSLWLKYKKDKGQKYKSEDSKLLAYKKLITDSNNNPDMALKIVEDAMAKNYSGFFPLKNDMKQVTTESKLVQ